MSGEVSHPQYVASFLREGAYLDNQGRYVFRPAALRVWTDRCATADQGQDFAGLTLEELMQFANNPYWMRIRRYLFASFWMIYSVLIVASILTVATGPTCPRDVNLYWWQSGAIYHVEVKSFRDTDMDGIGDLPGLRDKLSHIQELGFNIVQLTPSIYWSESRQINYGVLDFTTIDSLVGGNTALDMVIDAIHQKGMRIVLDFPLFATSREHHWFKSDKVEQHYLRKDNPGYVRSHWKGTVDTGTNISAIITEHQAVLNVASEEVHRTIVNAVRYWIAERNVDGFNFYLHFKLTKQPDKFTNDVLELFRDIRTVIDDIGARTMDQKLMMITILNDHDAPIDLLFEYQSQPLAHLVVPPIFTTREQYGSQAEGFPSSETIANRMRQWVVCCRNKRYNSNNDRWFGWQLGNPFVSRLSSRVTKSRGPRDARTALPLPFLMKGTPILFYGDEICLRSTEPTLSILRPGPLWCHESLAPMQWNSGIHSGFTEFPHTWLPVALDYVYQNVLRLSASGVNDSPLEQIKTLVKLRLSTPALLFGKLELFENQGHAAFWILSETGYPDNLVMTNLGKEDAHVTLLLAESCPPLRVTYTTLPSFPVNSLVTTNNIVIGEKGLLVLEWSGDSKGSILGAFQKHQQNVGRDTRK